VRTTALSKVSESVILTVVTWPSACKHGRVRGKGAEREQSTRWGGRRREAEASYLRQR